MPGGVRELSCFMADFLLDFSPLGLTPVPCEMMSLDWHSEAFSPF